MHFAQDAVRLQRIEVAVDRHPAHVEESRQLADGDREGARAALDVLAPDGELAVARDVLWLFAGATLLEIAEEVGDSARAERLYALVLPYRHLPVTSGVAYQGSAEKFLAAGARALGRYDDAVTHLEAALAFEEQLRARPYIGIICADFVRTLRARGADGDEDRAAAYERRAREIAAEVGSVWVERRLAGHYA